MRLALICVALLLLARPAHADIASSVYDDVRDVVEELIQTEVTTSVVSTIETRSPALAFYMHGTLERLASPYWGSLGRVLKDDLTVVVSDFVYWHLSTGGGDGDIVGSAKRFFKCVVQNGDANAGCKRLIAAVHDQGRPLIEVECRRTKPPAERRVACDIGLAVLAALQHRGEVRHHVLDALGDIVFAELAGGTGDSGLGDRMRDILTEWLDRPKNLPSGLLEALANPDLAAQLSDDAINTLCDDPKTIDSILHDSATSKGWICFAVTHHSLPNALAAKIAISDHGHTLDARLEYWVIEGALKDFDADRANDDSSFRMLADLAFDGRCPAGANINAWPCTGARLTPGATVTVEWLGREIVGTVDDQSQLGTKPNHMMMMKMLRFRKAIHRVEELRALVPPSLSAYLFFGGTAPREAKQVLRAMSRMARVVTELRARWYLVAPAGAGGGGNAELDIAELLHVARSSLGALRDSAHEAAGAVTSEVHAEEDKANDIAIGSLSFLDKTGVGGASSLDIGDWLRMVMREDYRSLAMESLRAALDIPLHDANRPRETFFLTLAAYLLDTGEGVNEAVARSAFRAAAKELLLSTSHRGVPRVGDRWRLRLLPSLSLRLSFNDAYAVTDDNTKRNMIAADWPTAMVAFTDYIGLQASILDPIAPLGEMALRPAGVYLDQSYIVLDALRPRLGTWVAVPQLSRRLALSIGFGARFLSLTKDAAATELTVHYVAKTSLVFDAGVQFVF